jgi:haloalkane dehalogenase
MAYATLGRANDPVVLLLHGEPNSSFVYREIAPLLAQQHFRVIVPDLVGFGYSDKPENPELISYAHQTKWLNAFIDRLDLTDIHLFAHDWGGMISLRIVAEKPHLFRKVAVSYSYLFEGDEKIPDSFLGFIDYARNDPDFSPGNIMDWGSKTKLPDSIKVKYNAPFQQTSDYLFARKFPSLIPRGTDDPEAIVNKKCNEQLKLFSKPFITIWGNHEDLMWKGKDSLLQIQILGAKDQTHHILNSGHFIQEDQPFELAKILIAFFKAIPGYTRNT